MWCNPGRHVRSACRVRLRVGIPSLAAVAARYARAVLAGRLPACIWVEATCQRHLADLARSKADRICPYRFDLDKAVRVCRQIELLPHIKGPKAKRGERIALEPWQVFILADVFGWVVRETGYRRYPRAYVEVRRDNEGDPEFWRRPILHHFGRGERCRVLQHHDHAQPDQECASSPKQPGLCRRPSTG